MIRTSSAIEARKPFIFQFPAMSGRRDICAIKQLPV
jgi:hypothetical protein